MDGGLRRTPRHARREALRLPANRKAHERGIVMMLAAATAAPMTRPGAYQGSRLR